MKLVNIYGIPKMFTLVHFGLPYNSDVLTLYLKSGNILLDMSMENKND